MRISHDGCDPLLAGLVIDAAGHPMVPSRRTASGRARYYVSVVSSPDGSERARIPAARLDRRVVGLLKRVGLLGEDWRQGDLEAVLHRVVVSPDAVELQIGIRACLAVWRQSYPDFGRVTIARVQGAMMGRLTVDEELAEVGSKLSLTTPRHSRNRCAVGRHARLMDMGEVNPTTAY
ncbi:hypothetical protein [Rhizomicrobium electricum]|nr:hypothetical protein [Rhizomicrobium electricum]NIJ46961.1 hypothetical protein [Rhizomicrobium electricum]